MLELEKLSKQELLEQIIELRTRLPTVPDSAETDSLLHELKVHEIELEMQNRELREAQQQLEETRDLYANLYDFSPVSYITLDAKGLVNNINLTGAAMLGKVRAQIIGQPFSRWVIKSEVGQFFSHLRSALMSDMKVTDEFRLRDAFGDLHEVRIESVRSKDAVNDAYLCRSVLFDVTEYNKTQKGVLLQERQLRLVTDALPVLIAYIDEYEQHQFVNKMYIGWFDSDAKELMGKEVGEVWGEANYLKIGAQLKIALSGRQIAFDAELYLQDKQKKSATITFIPDFDLSNHVSGVIAVINDITARLAVETLNRKRLLDVAHISRLSSMGEMASEIAHELNQPLAAISIYSDACRRMVISDKAKKNDIIKSLTDISAQAERAADVIRRIREFTSKKELSIARTDINGLVQEAVQLIAVELRSHNIQVELDLENDLPLVDTDKILVEQVIFNLIQNAIEAMTDVDELQRLLQIHSAVNATNEIEVNIKDSGPGLSLGQINQIFEAFYTTKANGVGLGLAICKSIIEAHQGRLWAVSNDPCGAVISFTIPLKGVKEDGAA